MWICCDLSELAFQFSQRFMISDSNTYASFSVRSVNASHWNCESELTFQRSCSARTVASALRLLSMACFNTVMALAIEAVVPGMALHSWPCAIVTPGRIASHSVLKFSINDSATSIVWPGYTQLSLTFLFKAVFGFIGVIRASF